MRGLHTGPSRCCTTCICPPPLCAKPYAGVYFSTEAEPSPTPAPHERKQPYLLPCKRKWEVLEFLSWEGIRLGLQLPLSWIPCPFYHTELCPFVTSWVALFLLSFTMGIFLCPFAEACLIKVPPRVTTPYSVLSGISFHSSHVS